MDVLKLALCHPRVPMDKSDAVEKAQLMVAEAAGYGANMVVLPEMFNCPYLPELFGSYEESAGGALVAELGRWARENGVWLIGGSLPERDGRDRYNTCFSSNQTERWPHV